MARNLWRLSPCILGGNSTLKSLSSIADVVWRFKVPREVFIEQSLPKNAVGKIAKPILRARFNVVEPRMS